MVFWELWPLRSPATRLFVQKFIQTYTNENDVDLYIHTYELSLYLDISIQYEYIVLPV